MTFFETCSPLTGFIHNVSATNPILFPAWLARDSESESALMPASYEDEDTRRMRAIAAGDESALRALILRWQQPLVSFLYRSCGSLDDAEELAQATFVRLYQAAGRYEARAKFSTYLFHIARRLMLNHLRSRQRKPAEPTPPEELPLCAEDPRPSQRARELEEIFEQALATLPEKQRTALLLLKQQELSYEEIAEAMNASLGAVKTWIHRAREQLRQHLQNTDNNSASTLS